MGVLGTRVERVVGAGVDDSTVGENAVRHDRNRSLREGVLVERVRVWGCVRYIVERGNRYLLFVLGEVAELLYLYMGKTGSGIVCAAEAVFLNSTVQYGVE